MGTVLSPLLGLFITFVGIFQADFPRGFAFCTQVWKTENSSCNSMKGADALPCPLSFKVSQTRATSAWRPACSWSSCPSTPRWRWCWRSCDTPSTTARTLSADEMTWQPHRPHLDLLDTYANTHTHTLTMTLRLRRTTANQSESSFAFAVNALHVCFSIFLSNQSLHGWLHFYDCLMHIFLWGTLGKLFEVALDAGGASVLVALS